MRACGNAHAAVLPLLRSGAQKQNVFAAALGTRFRHCAPMNRSNGRSGGARACDTSWRWRSSCTAPFHRTRGTTRRTNNHAGSAAPSPARRDPVAVRFLPESTAARKSRLLRFAETRPHVDELDFRQRPLLHAFLQLNQPVFPCLGVVICLERRRGRASTTAEFVILPRITATSRPL